MTEDSISIVGKTEGKRSSEHKVTWLTMLASLVAIAGQVVGKFYLGIDLGVDINLALATGFGSGAAYTMARMVVKTGIAYAEGKMNAAKADEVVKAKPLEDRLRIPHPKPKPTVAPVQSGPFSTLSAPPQEDTAIH